MINSGSLQPSPQDVEEGPPAFTDGVGEAQRQELATSFNDQRQETLPVGTAARRMQSVQFSTRESPTEGSPREISKGAEDALSRSASTTSGITPIGTRRGPPIRMMTSMQFGIPYNFFQSRAEIRTWGVEDEDLVDPSLQPIPPDSVPPKPFRTTLPGYTEAQARMLLKKQPAQPRDPNFGPEVSTFPPTVIPSCRPNPNFVQQAVGYECESDRIKHPMEKEEEEGEKSEKKED